jgi:hypothetical protein
VRMFAQDKMEEILSVMREIQELSTEHKSLNSVDTTEETVASNPETTEKTIVINADPIPHIDTNQFNQMLGRVGRYSMGSAFIHTRFTV